ncbi:O-antigen ligase family protein [Marininema halotolerans]|uniref:O-Antigen ligase n=1 Tax=Marininema halotolerans TaxID=1155944 RepID=A0A1I6P0Y9_9BACL|nr:O-antigen ligase family protein [Marininema halotolerans]SFS33837.1 O-Antigen ligase [Marininema halotolerans]
MTSLRLPRQQRLHQLFHLMIVFAVLGPTFGVPMGNFKMTFFRMIFLLLMAGVLIRWTTQRHMESSHMGAVRWHVAFFAFWIIYALASVGWAGHLQYGLKYSVFLVMMIVLCLLFPFFLQDVRSLAQTSRVLFGAFFIIVTFGLVESLTFWHLPASRYWQRDAPNPTSFFTNQNDFATVLTLGLPFLITALYMLPISRRAQGWIYATGIVTLCDLFITGSRSNSGFALPLLLVTWLILIPFTVAKEDRNRKNLAKGFGLVVLAVLITTLLLSSVLSQQTRDKLGSTLGIFQHLQSWSLPQDDEVLDGDEEQSRDQSVSIRKNLILHGLHFLKDSHYMGVGAGNIEFYMKDASGVGTKVNMHNWWVEILVNFGVPIFLLYMGLYGWLLWRLLRLARIKGNAQLPLIIRWGATASFIALIGYFFGGMSPSTAIHFTPMWIVYGFALAVVAIGERKRWADEGGGALWAEKKSWS